MGASSWDVTPLGAVSISRHSPALPVPPAHLLGFDRGSKRTGGGINPCWAPLDPDPAGTAGERPQHAAGSPAAGELHPEGCPQPGYQPDGKQVRLGWGAEPGAALWQTLAWPPPFSKVLLQTPQLAGDRGGNEGGRACQMAFGGAPGETRMFFPSERAGNPSVLWGHLC